MLGLAIEPLAAMLRESNLKGFQIPGADRRLIVNLFADDTTAFLDAGDSLDDLQIILDKWCLAAGAKFNISKTHILPIGSEEYRKEVIRTGKTSPDLPPLPGNLHVAGESEAIRILGAWFGNKIVAEQIWAATLEKIDTNLERWAKNSPTMEGRRYIIQMIGGGMTQ